FDPCLQLMMDAVHRFEGTVSRVLGDGIMALFGAPLALEDHPQRALYAALLMHEAVDRYAAELQRSRGITLQIRVGLNTGEVVVRAVGNDLHMDYSAVGHAVGLAARMEALATPGSTLVTARTWGLTQGSFRFAAQGPIQIKGVRDPIEVYELLGPSAPRSRLAIRAARGLSPFVGRARELAQLQEIATLVQNGPGQVVSLVGEAGVGKSRLLEEIKPVLRASGYLLIEGAGFAYGKTRAYLPLIQMLKRYCEIGDQDDPATYQRKLRSRLASVDISLVEYLPVFLELLGVESGDPQTTNLSAEARLQKIFNGTKQLIALQSRRQPVALIVEDLHWLDARSLAFLQGLITGIAALRVFFLLNYRPGNPYPWEDQSFSHRLRIAPLQQRASEEMFTTLVGTAPEVAALAPVVCQQSGGNPFFLEEIVQGLIETGVLAGQPGAYTLARRLSVWTLPATVQGLLASRLDRLSPSLKALLQTAAVIGREFSRALLARVARLPEQELNQALTILETREFLYETAVYPDTIYAFKHALTQEVAYQSLLHERRTALHAAVGAAAEALYAEKLPEYVNVLAYHYARSTNTDKALHYLHLAGLQAFNLCADTDALHFWGESLRVLATLPPGMERDRQEVRIRLHLINVLSRQDKDDGSTRAHFEAAEGVCRRLNDPRLLVKLHAALAATYVLWGRPRLGLTHAGTAKDLAVSLGDVRLRVMTLGPLASLLWTAGRFTEGRQAAEEGISLVQQYGLLNGPTDLIAYPSVQCLAIAGVCQGFLGDFAQGCGALQEAVASAGQHRVHIPQALSHWSLALLHDLRGDGSSALREANTALSIMQEVGAGGWSLLVGCARDYLAARQSDGPVPTPWLTQTWQEKRAFYELAGAWLAEATLRAGRQEEALRLATMALAEAEASESTWFLYAAHAALGRVLARLESRDDTGAETHLLAALRYAETMQSRPLCGRAALELGAVLSRKQGESERRKSTDEREQARAYLTRAVELCGTLGMDADCKRAQRLLAQLT
ncbi:MAG: ATP-binding protein, partial [Candidatus Binatia bacterium]